MQFNSTLHFCIHHVEKKIQKYFSYLGTKLEQRTLLPETNSKNPINTNQQ